MKYFIRIIVIIGIVGILIVYFIIGYNSKPHYNRKAIAYQKKGTQLLFDLYGGKIHYEGKLTPQQFKDSIYREVIHWYNLAIQKDPTYYMAYATKSSLYYKEIKLYDSALQALKTYYDVNKDSKIPEGLLGLGFCYDKIGDSIHALEQYQKAQTAFLLKKDTISALFTKMFIIGKDSALKEFNILFKKDLDTDLINEKYKPNDPYIVRKTRISTLYDWIIYFNKEKFLENLGLSIDNTKRYTPPK